MTDETAAPETPTPPTEPEAPALPPVTSVEEIRRLRRQRWRVTLPASGVVVQAHKPTWDALFLSGIIDMQVFLDLEARVVKGETIMPTEVLRHMVPVARAAAPYIIDDPPLVESGKPAANGALSVDDLDGLDLLALFTWARNNPSQVVAVPVLEQ